MPVAFGYRLLFGFSKDTKERGLEENLYRIERHKRRYTNGELDNRSNEMRMDTWGFFF